MKCATILIGNSDDKLSQREWSEFWVDVDFLLAVHPSAREHSVEFRGCCLPMLPFQNAAWVIRADTERFQHLKQKLAAIGKKYQQDSIAWIEGETELIECAQQ